MFCSFGDASPFCACNLAFARPLVMSRRKRDPCHFCSASTHRPIPLFLTVNCRGLHRHIANTTHPSKSVSLKTHAQRSTIDVDGLLSEYTMTGHTPQLPLSVEQAYRQKCIDLKKRLSECEDSNELLVVRNQRLKRGIQRLRLERALLLREIEERIQPRVDDSDGTPSPPPTVRSLPKVLDHADWASSRTRNLSGRSVLAGNRLKMTSQNVKNHLHHLALASLSHSSPTSDQSTTLLK